MPAQRKVLRKTSTLYHPARRYRLARAVAASRAKGDRCCERTVPGRLLRCLRYRQEEVAHQRNTYDECGRAETVARVGGGGEALCSAKHVSRVWQKRRTKAAARNEHSTACALTRAALHSITIAMDLMNQRPTFLHSVLGLWAPVTYTQTIGRVWSGAARYIETVPRWTGSNRKWSTRLQPISPTARACTMGRSKEPAARGASR